MMKFWTQVFVITAKDLRAEFRTKEAINASLAFALVILIMVLGAREAIKRRVGAPAALGIPWVRGERGT